MRWPAQGNNRYQERERDQAKQGRSILDQVKWRSPAQNPDEEGRYRKEIMPRDACEQRERNSDAPNLRRQQQTLSNQFTNQREEIELEAEVFTDGIRIGFLREGSETTDHLHEENNSHRRYQHSPDQPETEFRACLA